MTSFTLLGVDHNQLDLNSDVSISVSHQNQTSNYYEISYYIVYFANPSLDL